MKPTILYLHGLDGSLNEEKRAALEQHFVVIAPQINYREQTDVFDNLSAILQQNMHTKAVIGNSMGGLFSYHLSQKHALPALLFNPALPLNSLGFSFPDSPTNRAFTIFVLGGKDTVVPAMDNANWIIRNNKNENFIMKWYNKMEHRVDIDTFTHEINEFAQFIG